MAIPKLISVEHEKKRLENKGKLLSLRDPDSLSAVACFLHDMSYDFSLVIEDNVNIDPFAMPTEKQLTELHKLFKRVLKKQPYNYSERDFQRLYQDINAICYALFYACVASKIEH